VTTNQMVKDPDVKPCQCRLLSHAPQHTKTRQHPIPGRSASGTSRLLEDDKPFNMVRPR